MGSWEMGDGLGGWTGRLGDWERMRGGEEEEVGVEAADARRVSCVTRRLPGAGCLQGRPDVDRYVDIHGRVENFQ